MHKISQAYIVLAYGKPFITEVFEEPSYILHKLLLLMHLFPLHALHVLNITRLLRMFHWPDVLSYRDFLGYRSLRGRSIICKKKNTFDTITFICICDWEYFMYFNIEN